MAELNTESTPPAEQEPTKKVTGEQRDLISSQLATVTREGTRRVLRQSNQTKVDQYPEEDTHGRTAKKLTRRKNLSKKARSYNTLGEPAELDGNFPTLTIVAPQTPVSTLMDSDDDINSVASSDGFGMDEAEDSDISLPGGGESCKILLCGFE